MEGKKPSEEAYYELYQEFLHDCTKFLRDEDPKFLDAIKRRYEECDEQFRRSSKMIELLQQTQRKMKNEESRKFVHLKDFLTELKKFSTNRKKKAIGKSQSKSIESEISTSPVSKFPKLADCSVVLVKIDASDEYDNGRRSQVQLEEKKSNKCFISDGSIDDSLTIEMPNTDEKQMSKEQQKISQRDYPFCPSFSTNSHDTDVSSRSTLSPLPGCRSSTTSSVSSWKSGVDEGQENTSNGKSKSFICSRSASNLTSSNNSHTTEFHRGSGLVVNVEKKGEEKRQTMSSDSETEVVVSPVNQLPKLADCSVVLVKIDTPDEYGNSSWSQGEQMSEKQQDSSKHDYSFGPSPSTSLLDETASSRSNTVSPLPWCGCSASSSWRSRSSIDDNDLEVESNDQSEELTCTATSSRSSPSPVPWCSNSNSGSIGCDTDSSSSTSIWSRNSTDNKDCKFESNGKIKDTSNTGNLMRSHVKTKSSALCCDSIAVEDLECMKKEEKWQTGSSDSEIGNSSVSELPKLVECSVVLVKMEAYDEYYHNRLSPVQLEKTKAHKCSASVSDGNIDDALTIEVLDTDEKQMSKQQHESSKHITLIVRHGSTNSKDTVTYTRSRTRSPIPRCGTGVSNVSSSIWSRSSTNEKDLEMESNDQTKDFICASTSSTSTLSPEPGCNSSTISSIRSRDSTDDKDLEFESNGKINNTTCTRNLMSSFDESNVLYSNSLAIKMENWMEEKVQIRSSDSDADKSPIKFPKLAECSVVLVKMEACDNNYNNRWSAVQVEQMKGHKCSANISDGNIDNALTIEVANADEKQMSQPDKHDHFNCSSPTANSKDTSFCGRSDTLSPIPGCGSSLSSVSSRMLSRGNSTEDQDWESE